MTRKGENYPKRMPINSATTYTDREHMSIDVAAVGGGVTLLTINRPYKANALDAAMHLKLTTVWQELQDDDTVGAVVITGSGTTFCGGGDRDAWDKLRNDRAYRRRRMTEARNLLLNMLRCELPVVAAINGPAIGVGCTIALATDVLIMTPTSYLADPHVSSGIVAGDGGALLLPLLVGLPLARQVLYMGRRIDADTAQRVDLASDVVPAESLLPRALEIAEKLAAQPPEALRDTKRAVNLHILAQGLVHLEFGSMGESASFDTDAFGHS
jgi:enoyl-CoA hydratase